MSEKEVKEELLDKIQKWAEEHGLETSAEMDVELALSVLELFNKAIKEAVEKERTRAL